MTGQKNSEPADGDAVFDAAWELVAALANDGLPKEPRSRAAFDAARIACLDRLKADNEPARPSLNEALEALRQINKFAEDFFSPWGSWKTAWWEGAVSDDKDFTTENALKAVAKTAREALTRLTKGES